MLKLVYFKMRALAEAPQLLLEYSGLEYEYLMSWDHFDDVWSKVKPMIPFQQLPMMERRFVRVLLYCNILRTDLAYQFLIQ